MKYASGRFGATVNGFYTKLKNITGQGAVIGADGSTTWRVTVDPEARSYGAEVEAFVALFEGLQVEGSGTFLRAEQGPGIDSLVGERLAGVPTVVGNLAAIWSPGRAAGLQLKADWHYVGSRLTEAPRDRVNGTELPDYNYFNFGVGCVIPNSGTRFNVDLLNAFQSKGLEEGNPRIVIGRPYDPLPRPAHSTSPAPGVGQLRLRRRPRATVATAVIRALTGLWCGIAMAPALATAQSPVDSTGDSTFVLATEDPARAPSPFIGNGRFSLVIPPLGLAAERSYATGLYEHGPGDVPRIVALPAWNGIRVFDGERWLEDTLSAGDSVQSYRQAIDMRTGTASTGYERVSGTRRTSVRVETFVSRASPRVAAIRLELVPRQAGRLRVRFALAGWPRPHRLPLDTLSRTQPGWGPKELWYPGHMVVRSRTADKGTAAGSGRLSLAAIPEGRSTVLAEVAELRWPRDLPGVSVRTLPEPGAARIEVAFDATPDRTYTFTQVVGFGTSTETSRALDRARTAAGAAARGYDSLAAENTRAWARRWETDIVLDGDPELQRVVHAMLFYLLASADSGTSMGIPPMGLSSAGYYGHIFWDSDTWMFPALVLTHPDVAHSMVAFRARTLPAAQANARANGYRGAMYPWEADERGVETTPHFAAQNASSEIHVNGDVALAQWQYYLATNDSSWLVREGFPVIRGTADFWVSRASYDSTNRRYHIRNVVSVAEGLVGVSDDAYTNAVARRNLEMAIAAARRLGVAADPRWSDVAGKLHLPVDSASGFFRTYEGAPDSTLGWVTPLLAFPLGVPMSDTAKRAHLDQAVHRLADEAAGAMMGITLLSVGAAELGDRKLVDSLLPFSYRHHLKGPFLLPSETPTNNAFAFLTGAGGFLQQVIFGYTGLRLGEQGLEPAFPPVLPSRVRRLLLKNVPVRGKRIDVLVDSTGRHVTERKSGGAPDAGRAVEGERRGAPSPPSERGEGPPRPAASERARSLASLRTKMTPVLELPPR